MAYKLDIPDHLDKIFLKLSKKDRKQLESIHKKINEIVVNPHHYKPLRGDMHGALRVHIHKSFVLTYEIDEKNKVVRLLDYDHHDNIY
ncbi:type II toxin-antitoxin system mRNA interferase toxin, RelE/StbE family [Candidatus Woesearchaeota archaeon]|nr:type II toxin-antitoxin system mRNA interferase toxin, RelE/StbE family [Candidatus Woesearchaeota archaeon]